MSIELKQAAKKALVVLGSATSFMSRKARDQHESVVAELSAAIQQAEAQQPATGEPAAWPLMARVWKRESTQEWVLEIAGTLGDTDMNIRHTQPLSVAYEDVPGLPTIYTHPAQSVFLVRDIASLLGASVPDVCNALAELGYEPRRSTNAAISPDEALAVASRLRPAPSVLKDDQIAALVNKVRDIARMFNDHQSLRERIAIELVPALKVSQEVKSNAERGRFLVGWLKRFGLLQAEFGQMGAGEKPENWWLLHAPWGIDQTRPFFGHGKTPEQAIDAAMLAANEGGK